jgi:hypothetical protein
MTVQTHVAGKARVNEALEICVQVGLAALLVIGCLLILRPFIPLILWGIIIAVASYLTFGKLQSALGGRASLSAVREYSPLVFAAMKRNIRHPTAARQH